MSTDSNIKTIAVIGAGQMGGGIAQVAAVRGFDTLVYDAFPTSLARATATNAKRLAREVEKERMTPAAVAAALLVETILHRKKWSLQDWDSLYEDLPSKQLKNIESTSAPIGIA